jgi:hypothetical protein
MDTNDKPLPGMVFFLTQISKDTSQSYLLDEEIMDQSIYSQSDNLNYYDDLPLYTIRFRTPPTSCHTPGKWIPGGFTPSGKYRSGYTRPAKTDKRAGK